MKKSGRFLCGGEQCTRHVRSCEHLKLPEDLLMCNLGNIGHSFLIEGINVMNPQTCYYLLLAAKAGNLQGCRSKNRIQRS